MGHCVFLLFVLAVAIAMTSCSSSLPQHSEQSIRQQILRDTPLGSGYAVDLDYARKKDWPVTEESGGFETKRVAQFPARVVGQRVIKAYLGGYQGVPWRKDVNFYWAFDEHDKLIEGFVEKQADAP
jgi:hypothetical protein